MTVAAVGVSVPLLWANRNGWVLLLDWAPGPRSAEFDWVQLPSGPLLKLAVDLVGWWSPVLVGSVMPAAAVSACFAAGGWFVLRWKASVLCALAGGAAASMSPFVINRLYVGQVGVLFGAAALLLFAAAVVDAAETCRVGPSAVWAVVAPAFSLHLVVPVLTVAVLGAVLVARRNSKRAAVRWFSKCAGVVVVAAAAWAVPTVLSTSGGMSSPGTAAGVATFTVDGSWWSLPWSLMLGSAFWRSTPQLLAVPAVVVACVSFVALVARWFHGAGWTRDARSVVFGSLVVGVVAASLGRGVFGQLWNVAVSSVPLVGLYREPGKMLVLTVPALSVGAAALVPSRRYLGGVVVAVLCAASAFTLSQLSVVAPPVSYPSSWVRAEAIARDGCRIAVIGDEAYAMPFFASGRVVANPASGFFGARAAVSNDPRVEGLYPRNGGDEAAVWVSGFHRAVEKEGSGPVGSPVLAGVGWALVDRPASHRAEVAELERSGFEVVFSTAEAGLWRTVEPCFR